MKAGDRKIGVKRVSGGQQNFPHTTQLTALKASAETCADGHFTALPSHQSNTGTEQRLGSYLDPPEETELSG